MAKEDKQLDPQTDNPGLNDELKKAVDNQGSVKPEDYPEPARLSPAPKGD